MSCYSDNRVLKKEGSFYSGIAVERDDMKHGEEICSELENSGFDEYSCIAENSDMLSIGTVVMIDNSGPYRVSEESNFEDTSEENSTCEIICAPFENQSAYFKINLIGSYSWSFWKGISIDGDAEWLDVVNSTRTRNRYEVRVVSDEILARVYEDLDNYEEFVSRTL